MTYAEYLRSQGATEDDIKVMDTPVGRKAYETLQTQAATSAAEALAAKEHEREYFANMNNWHDGVEKDIKKTEGELIAAKTREAAAVAALRTAHDRGLLDVAKDLGFNLDAPVTPPAKKDEPVAIDTSKFVTTDNIEAFAERAGAGLAVLQDIVMEHAQLFPDKPLRVAQLRSEAVAAKMSVEAYWLKQYNIPAVRDARDKAAKEAYDKRLIEQGRQQAASEFADKYGTPDARPLVESRNFLVPRKDSGREKQPWEAGTDGESGSNDRVKRATQAALKAQHSGVH